MQKERKTSASVSLESNSPLLTLVSTAYRKLETGRDYPIFSEDNNDLIGHFYCFLLRNNDEISETDEISSVRAIYITLNEKSNFTVFFP